METIKVRIALEIDHEGNWQASGGDAVPDDWDSAISFDSLGNGARRYWIEAEVPVPAPATEPATVTGEAVPA